MNSKQEHTNNANAIFATRSQIITKQPGHSWNTSTDSSSNNSTETINSIININFSNWRCFCCFSNQSSIIIPMNNDVNHQTNMQKINFPSANSERIPLIQNREKVKSHKTIHSKINIDCSNCHFFCCIKTKIQHQTTTDHHNFQTY